MILKTGTFYGMAQDIIKTNSMIVVFGTGVIGSAIIPELLKEYNLYDRVIFYIDNDKSKWNATIQICGREIQILPPDSLVPLHQNITVLVAISRFFGALKQLNQMETTKSFSCYIIPCLCLQNFHVVGKKDIENKSINPLIPKKIHYMWLGGTKIPLQLQRCIDSWKRYCPDYDIIRWDESNYDVHKNRFVAQAYDLKKFGFVPDYARIELLYEHGGIYLDTDVELQRNLDDLLYQEAFCSVEKWQVLNFGGCSGAVKGHKSLIPFLDSWSKRSLIREDGTIDNTSSGLIDTEIAIKAGYKINGMIQNIMGMNIYTYDFFHPYDYMSGKLEMSENTFSVHKFYGGWVDEAAKEDGALVTKKYDELMAHALIV